MESVAEVFVVINILPVEVENEDGHIAEGVNAESGISAEEDKSRDKERSEINPMLFNKGQELTEGAIGVKSTSFLFLGTGFGIIYIITGGFRAVHKGDIDFLNDHTAFGVIGIGYSGGLIRGAFGALKIFVKVIRHNKIPPVENKVTGAQTIYITIIIQVWKKTRVI